MYAERANDLIEATEKELAMPIHGTFTQNRRKGI